VPHCGILSTPPLPYSVRKLLIINDLREGCGFKILSVLDLAAESSQHWSYGRILDDFFGFISYDGILAVLLISVLFVGNERAGCCPVLSPSTIVRHGRAILCKAGFVVSHPCRDKAAA
jgi:hypothetical protein